MLCELSSTFDITSFSWFSKDFLGIASFHFMEDLTSTSSLGKIKARSRLMISFRGFESFFTIIFTFKKSHLRNCDFWNDLSWYAWLFCQGSYYYFFLRGSGEEVDALALFWQT